MRMLIVTIYLAMVLSCTKNIGVQIESDYVHNATLNIQKQLSRADRDNLDFAHAVEEHAEKKGIHFLRIPVNGKTVADDFLLIKTDSKGNIQTACYITFAFDTPLDRQQRTIVNGTISYRRLTGEKWQYRLEDGRIVKNVVKATNDINNESELPPVIVYTSYGNGAMWSYWYDLTGIFGVSYGGGANGSTTIFLSQTSPAPGGGGAPPGDLMGVDIEMPENKTAIDIFKFMNCFTRVPSNGATFSITIHADIPKDGDPDKQFFGMSPGHAFITLNKSSASNSVSQNIGFYPAGSYTAISGLPVSSKVVDDGGHETNAKFTISVTESQFNSAVASMLLNSGQYYDLTGFNCCDFALQAFYSAGGNLDVNKTLIPINSGGNSSYTPQGIYKAIKALADGGNVNASTNSNKQYTNTSHGPCV